ncbi:ERI1 exoribonuclease 2 isoform X2 [Triplophysa rosa]|uniref:ERI1 exoribonuclease 2 n=1 Tax=Triplophysa rosa TaxID=992332 RepID=A0A9W8C8A6_TRIRA|nr:ERI1 exoribonuclease 2 isoform X2 [Triplophysa rosa]KAI7810655.1 ERI1 exoribonuclease 2 [Triplophysa rosa]
MSTKRLAKELGLIRKRSQSCGDARRQPSVRKQHITYVVIIDFESTCWREKTNFGPEISKILLVWFYFHPSLCLAVMLSALSTVEFPAVLLNALNGEIESEFHTYVQPQEHPVLSEFCTELTGITQEQVESAPPLQVCLSRFLRWLQTLQQERGVVFVADSKSFAPSGRPCAFITWSDWDLGVCLLYECRRKQMTVPDALKSWIDLRATYRLFYNRKPKGLRGALQDLGIQFTGREHSGLVDARNTALLAWRMLLDGCVLRVTKSLKTAQVKSRAACRNTECSTRPSAVCEEQMSVCQALVSPHTVFSTAPSRVNKYKPNLQNSTNILLSTTLAALSDTTYDPETPDACWKDGVLLTEEEESGSYDDVILGAELEDAVPSVTVNSAPPLRSRNTELCIRSRVTVQPNKTTSNHHPSRPASSTELFKTPKPVPRTDPYASVSRFFGLKTAPFSVYKDPSTRPPVSTSARSCVSRPPPLSSAVNHSVRRTSALCGCGRRARRLTVGNGGPNHGRVFYCCPVRRQSCDGRRKGCEFFQWESSTHNTSSVKTIC